MVLDNPDAEAPAVVRALVEAGASIRAVFDDQPPLEDVYLRLMSSASGASPRRRTRHDERPPDPDADHREGTARIPFESGCRAAGRRARRHLRGAAVLRPDCHSAGHRKSLAADRTIRGIVALAARTQPYLALLPPGTAAEAFLFQQFLLLFLVAPIVGAVSLAAYSVVGEKQGRTLEPLLTTPITTAELLIAKVLASFLPSLAVEAAGLVVYVALVVRSRHRVR